MGKMGKISKSHKTSQRSHKQSQKSQKQMYNNPKNIKNYQILNKSKIAPNSHKNEKTII